VFPYFCGCAANDSSATTTTHDDDSYTNYTLSLFLALSHHPTSGYSRQYQALARFLSAQFSDQEVEVIGKMDRGITGNFEVTTVDSGTVLHSKRHAGQGKAESAAERARIVEQIRELLLEEEHQK